MPLGEKAAHIERGAMDDQGEGQLTKRARSRQHCGKRAPGRGKSQLHLRQEKRGAV